MGKYAALEIPRNRLAGCFQSVWRELGAELVLAVLIAGSYLFWGTLRLEGDAVQYYALAEAFHSTRLRTVAPEAYLDRIEPHRRIFLIHPRQGHPAVFYPPGYAYIAWPALVLADTFWEAWRDAAALWSDVPIHRIEALELWFLFLTWAALVVLYRTLVHALAVARRWALVGVIAVFLGTPWWFYSTRQVLYSHAPELALLVMGLAALVGAWRSRCPGWAWLFGGLTGFCWGLAGATRYPAWLWGLVVGGCVLIAGWRSRRGSVMARWALGAVVTSLPWLFLVLIYQARFYGAPFATGYAPRFFAWHHSWHEAWSLMGFRVWAVWVHPIRGFLLWHPVALVALVGWKRLPGLHRAWTLGSVLAMWLLIATYTDWWGGASFGQRLMLELVPALTFALAMQVSVMRRWGRLVLGLVVAWNVVLSVGYTGEAWKGYNDGRRGERFPVMHLVRRITQEPCRILKRFRERVWQARLHPLAWASIKVQEMAASRVLMRPEGKHTLGLWFVTQHRKAETVHMIVSFHAAKGVTYPAGWWWTAVSHARRIQPGAHAWHIMVGGSAPMVRFQMDGAEVPLHHMFGAYDLPFTDRGQGGLRVRFTLLRREDWTARTFTAEGSLEESVGLFPKCRVTYRSTGLRNRYRWKATGAGELWIWAWPYLESPWFQVIRTVRVGEELSIPPRAAQIGRQPYRGRVITCYLPAAGAVSGPGNGGVSRSIRSYTGR